MSAIDEILISVAPGEVRAALLRRGRLEELMVERRGRESLVGSVYVGRVLRVLDGLDAAFVELGGERPGFLTSAEARPARSAGQSDRRGERLSQRLSEGDAVLVQVIKDPTGDKGPALSLHVTLPGPFLVYAPFDGAISVSRRIADAAERDRLETVVEQLVNAREGVIARTSAAGVPDDVIGAELGRLRGIWRGV
ncbi:MAG: ribonuclease E/G, partial [Alphaproteobacteria bacterium]